MEKIATMMNWPLLLLGAFCLLALLDVMLHLAYALVALRYFEHRPAFAVNPPSPDAPLPENINFFTADGVELAGGVYLSQDGPARGVVVFCPETDGSYLTASNYVPALVDAGIAVVTFSFRNQSPSESVPGYRASHWFTSFEVSDVCAALDFVESLPQFTGLPVGLMGVSRGAGAALAAGATRPEVVAIWSQGGFSTYQLALHHALKWIQIVMGQWCRFVPKWHVAMTISCMLQIAEWKNRIRFLHLESLLPLWKGRAAMFTCGARDTYVPLQLTKLLCLQSNRSLDEGFWVVPLAKHNAERIADPREFDERLVEFFDRAMEPASVNIHGQEVVAG